MQSRKNGNSSQLPKPQWVIRKYKGLKQAEYKKQGLATIKASNVIQAYDKKIIYSNKNATKINEFG